MKILAGIPVKLAEEKIFSASYTHDGLQYSVSLVGDPVLCALHATRLGLTELAERVGVTPASDSTVSLAQGG